ncbi:lactococcin 972 family bacteriocin [Nonomuraea sp. NPDC000554]|uniref:lactococcin 972 family bacteriocin n=1 Tax=Nonomuraea sp. NPDC000554 TaxID=3154259 RepID=UPI0033307704
MRKTLKRGLVMAAAVGAVVLGGVSAAVADGGTDTPTEGSVMMNPGDVSIQSIKNVGGGTWNFGTHASNGWSDYLHNKKCHGSSTSSGHHYNVDHDIRAGNWSQSKVWRDGSAGIKAYWTNTGSC